MALIYTRDRPKRKKLTPKQIKDQEALAAAAKALKQKWTEMVKFADRNTTQTKKKEKKVKHGPPPLTNPPGRPRQVIPSLTTPGGEAVKRPDKVYTGDKLLGVATMHKSNAIPVFNDQHLVDIASMRRNEYEREVKKNPIDDNGILPPSDQL